MRCSHPSDALSRGSDCVRRKTNRPWYEGICAFTARRYRSRRGGSGLSQRGFVTPQPHKRPKGSYLRFAAEQPNERWQADITQ